MMLHRSKRTLVVPLSLGRRLLLAGSFGSCWLANTVHAQAPVSAQRTVASPPPSLSIAGGQQPVPRPTQAEQRRAGSALAGLPLYSIGDPSDVEVRYVELINRARANAPAEATRLVNTTEPSILSAYSFFAVDLNLFQSQMGSLPATLPPLAFDATLGTVARLHSEDMFENVFQGHVSSANPPPPFPPNATLGQRLSAFFYSGAASENVFAFGENSEQGHAGFEVDWGSGPGGMQTPPGHRLAIHNASRNTIGVGVLEGTNSNGTTTVGPQVVTEVLGVSSANFITGVTFFDLDGDAFYDEGEGIGGVGVNVSTASFAAQSSAAGAWAIPVPGNGNYTLTFSASGMSNVVRSVAVSGANRKQDLILSYVPPAVTGPTALTLGVPATFALGQVPAASGYDVEITRIQIGPHTEGAELGQRAVTIASVGGYDVIESQLVHGGSFAFHLAHRGISTEIVELDASFGALPSSSLSFHQRLGFATSDQVTRVQVSTDGGQNWSDIFTRAGTGGAGDTNWLLSNLSLGTFAGQNLRVRFAYEFAGGSFFNQTTTNVGWLFDDIVLSNVEIPLSVQNLELGPTSSFAFTPASAGVYKLRARAENQERDLPYGAALQVTASDPVPLFGALPLGALALALCALSRRQRELALRARPEKATSE